MSRQRHASTVVAISSAAGSGPEAILRLSGPRAFELVDGRFAFDDGTWPPPEGYVAAEGRLAVDGLPPVPLTVYRMTAPRTFTGEDLVELHLPGNALLAHKLLEGLVAAGAELAGPGEFTRRAFENGRIDLAQAEGIMALIRSRSDAEARAALAGVSGEFSARLGELRAELLALSGLLEASLDFSDRGLGDDLVARAGGRLAALCGRLGELLAAPGPTAEGDLPRVLLYGPTNVGKSTLFNALLGAERAVVDPRPGTTRDPVRAEVAIGGLRLALIDPAGQGEAISELDDRAQRLAREQLPGADLVLLVSDGAPLGPPDGLTGACLRVRTKTDVPSQILSDEDVVAVSALTGAGLDRLRQAIVAALVGEVDRGSRFLLNTRQRVALRGAEAALGAAQSLLQSGEGAELAAFELAEARRRLGEVTGELLPDDVLGAIFAEFCIGK